MSFNAGEDVTRRDKTRTDELTVEREDNGWLRCRVEVAVIFLLKIYECVINWQHMTCLGKDFLVSFPT